MTALNLKISPKEVETALALNFYLVDRDTNSLIFDLEKESYFDGAKLTEQQYDALTGAIDDLEDSGQGYRVYCWYDISGYKYWVKDQEETNYVQMTVIIEPSKFNGDYASLNRTIARIENELSHAIKNAGAQI